MNHCDLLALQREGSRRLKSKIICCAAAQHINFTGMIYGFYVSLGNRPSDDGSDAQIPSC